VHDPTAVQAWNSLLPLAMTFLEDILSRMLESADRPVLEEVRDGQIASASGRELLALIAQARAFLRSAGLQKGDRCALLAPNSIRWAALDLAIMAEGIIVVPLYARQAPAELAAMMKDCSPSLLLCEDSSLRDGLIQTWPSAPRACLFGEVFTGAAGSWATAPPSPLAGNDPVTIIYTSGTSCEPKGVILTVANLNHMVPCTNERLDRLMGPRSEPDRVFHYLPFCFAGSWILLLTCLSRSSVLMLSTDLAKLGEELKLAAPNYFLNVPTLLERVRSRVEEQVMGRGGIAASLFSKARAAYLRLHRHEARPADPIWLALANALMFPAIRKSLGPNLRAIICGSAPLAVETQLFFFMLGIRVLQVYGLTETTAICTMDDPHHVEPGRVGPAVPGVEMKLGENGEILVHGPNIFPGYWNKPEATARVLRDGWFYSGDQGNVSSSGNWRIIGRLKDLIILNSGHNIAPEPLEDLLLKSLPGAQQAMLVGNNRSYLVALVSGAVSEEQIGAAVEKMNAGQPHYKQIRSFHAGDRLFTIENGLLTANGKLRRGLIAERYRDVIEELYQKH
jgi:long-chain acyl-CoA synthetase